jgi:peptidoglycan hydrolase-like protein with peptidoglycan-binding domain
MSCWHEVLEASWFARFKSPSPGKPSIPKALTASFGKATEAAVKAFQQSSSFEPTGRVDVGTWMALLSMPAPNTQERALQLTAAFEGHGFSLAQGNWDGAGITWGIIGFTLKHGALGKIILTVFDESPALVQQSFGGNTEEIDRGAPTR